MRPEENTSNSSPFRRRRMQSRMITCILLFLAAKLVDGGPEEDDDMIEMFDTTAPAPKAPKDIIWLTNADFELTNLMSSNNATVLATVADTKLIPNWLPGGAGVEILQSSSYQMSTFGPSVFAIHLNNPASSNGTQGSIATLNLTTNPHPATLYTVQYDCARNPDGPLNLLTALKISSMSGITVNYWSLHRTIYNTTDTRKNITWVRQSFLYMGTGAPTSIQFESMSEKYGPIIDNVMLLRGVHIIRNGSAWTTPSFLLRMCTLFALMNGDFNVEGFVFNQYPVMDVIATGINTLVPFWAATEGGVQMLDTNVYRAPAGVNSSTIVHLNHKYGPGRVVSMPIYTLRDGALYTVSCRLGDNPDGGPVYKAMRLGVSDIFGKRLGPKLEPFVVSNHSTTRSNILWETVALNVRGTGKPAILTVESNTPGSYGPLVADVQVMLSNIVENGSFEDLDATINTENVTYFVELSAPSAALLSWSLDAGSLKIASAARYQASTDNTAVMLDLNADANAAMVSTTFAIKPKTRHVLLFDSAINPEEANPVQGQILVLVQGHPSATMLLNKEVDMDSTGFSVDNVGWNTYEFEFETGKQDIKAKVTFQSKMFGNFGPLLDNVCVYEVMKSLSNANETISDVPASVASSNFAFYTNLHGDAHRNHLHSTCRSFLLLLLHTLLLL